MNAAAGFLGTLIVARNEERSLGACIDAWQAAARHADRAAPLLVVLDACTDGSAAVAAAHGAETLACDGGKVTALETGRDELLRRRPDAARDPHAFVICSDADVLAEAPLLSALCQAMDGPSVHVAFPNKRPLSPRRQSLLARSLYTYNRHAGFASRRTWFSGQTFAIRTRDFAFPSGAELAARARLLPRDNFLRLDAPLRTDDVYLSQALLAAHGLDALRPVDAVIWYRGPETLAGMYSRYRRMQAELERVARLFPEFEAVRRAFGARVSDQVRAAPAVERLHFRVVQAAVALCRLGYRLDRLYHRHVAARAPDLWPPVIDTKLSADDARASSILNSGTPLSPDAPCSPGATTPTSLTT